MPHDPILFISAITLLTLICAGRSYKDYLTLFKGDWLLGRIKLWPIVGLVLAGVSQYWLCQSTTNPALIATVDGIALYITYIQSCRD